LLIYLFDELPMSFEPLFMKAPRRTAATSNGFSDAYRDVPCTPPARTNGTENVQHAKAIAAIAVARLDMYRLTRASSACAHVVCELVTCIRVGKNEAPFPFRFVAPSDRVTVGARGRLPTAVMAQNADNFKVEILVDGQVREPTINSAHHATRRRPRPEFLNSLPPKSQPLDVHVGRDGQKWVTSSFNAGSTKMIEYAETDPFGERYTQRWPATPYSVRVTCTSPGSFQSIVYVDGKLACSRYHLTDKPNTETFEFKGFQANISLAYCMDEISEFMFTLPRAEVRPAGAPVPEPNPELGTIVVKLWEMRQRPGQIVVDPAAARGGARVKPATKAALAKGGKATTATASGNQIQAMRGRAYTANTYAKVGTHPVATCRYNYATRSQLQMRGIINPEIVVPVPKDEDVEVVEAAQTGRAKRRKKEEEFKVDKDGVISFD
jgi:hypothetical protein